MCKYDDTSYNRGNIARLWLHTKSVLQRDVAKNLGLYGELHRFIPVLADLYGAKMIEMPVAHYPRVHGVSKYGIGRTIRVLCDLMLMVFLQKYAARPMHLFGTLGLMLCGVGLGGTIYGVVATLGDFCMGRYRFVLGIWYSCISFGIQMITMGFLAEMVMRTYYESQGKRPYRLKISTKRATHKHQQSAEEVGSALGDRICASIFALYLSTSQLAWPAVVEAASKLSLSTILGVFLYNSSQVLGAMRCLRYLNAIGIDLDSSQNIALYYLGMFYNIFLPGAVGGGWI